MRLPCRESRDRAPTSRAAARASTIGAGRDPIGYQFKCSQLREKFAPYQSFEPIGGDSIEFKCELDTLRVRRATQLCHGAGIETCLRKRHSTNRRQMNPVSSLLRRSARHSQDEEYPRQDSGKSLDTRHRADYSSNPSSVNNLIFPTRSLRWLESRVDASN